MAEKKSDRSLLCRMAGNILSRHRYKSQTDDTLAVRWAVALARATVAEVDRTEPDPLRGEDVYTP